MSPDPRLQLLWYKARTVKIHKSSPESDRRSLIHHKSRVHIEFYKPNNGTSEYIIDKVGSHRWRLDFLAGNGVAQQPDNYNVYEGVVYPADLSTAPGVWRDPLPFLFPNLIVINFDLQTALYWAIPIMTATSDTFRRLIIQRIDDLHMLPFPFPFTAFDDCLVQHPLIGVLLLYDGIDCIPIYQQRLPLIVLRDQVKFVEQRESVSLHHQ